MVVCILVFLIAFFPLHRKGKMLVGFLFVMGIIIHYFQGNRALELFSGITQNLALLSIILLAPLLSIPLKREGVIDGVVTKLDEQKNNERRTFYGVSTFMMFLAPILNMGALRIVHGFVENLHISAKLLSRSYYGGFTPAVIWSPFFASVGIVLYIAELSYLSYMLVGITFAFLQVVIGIILLRPEKGNKEKVQNNPTNRSADRKNVFLLIGFVFGLLALLIIEEAITHQPMLLLVCLNCLLIPFLWVIFRRKFSEMKSELRIYKDRVTNKSNMEMGIFLGAGLFGNALVQTSIVDVLQNVIVWSSEGSIFFLFLFVICFITLMAVIGIHQIIVVPIILTILLTSDINISMLAAAFMCIFSWMLSSAISPLNALNIIISSCVRKDGLTVAFKWNGKYFFGVTGMAFIYVYFLNVIG